jgi:hypothetical protein
MAMENAEDMLASMGIDIELVEMAEAVARTRKPRDQRICACGHAVNRHSMDSGRVECKPSAYRCECRRIHPVLEVEDTRLFLRKTTGPGPEHALARGLLALSLSNKKAIWLDGVACEMCGTMDTQGFQATPINQFNGAITIAYDGATALNGLLCPICREKLIS